MNARSRTSSRLPLMLAAAAALAVTAAFVRRGAHKAERHHPPLGRFVEVDGVRLHYLESGSGQTVILLHGNGARADDFTACGLIDALAARYRVIAFDRPGFGHTLRPTDRVWSPAAQAEFLLRAATVLGVSDAVILAHSFATQVALEMALLSGSPANRTHFPRVRGLVLVSGYYFPTLRLDSWLMAIPAIPLLGKVMSNTLSPVLSRLILPLLRRALFAPREVPDSFLRGVPKGLMLRPWQIEAAAGDSGAMVPEARRLAKRYRGIQQPVEIFAGAQDKLVRPTRQAVRLQGELPNGRLHLIEGEGHMLHYGMSAALGEAVDRVTRESAG